MARCQRGFAWRVVLRLRPPALTPTVTQPSVAPFRGVFQTVALGSLAVGLIRRTTGNAKTAS
jgi:hypothetical protein